MAVRQAGRKAGRHTGRQQAGLLSIITAGAYTPAKSSRSSSRAVHHQSPFASDYLPLLTVQLPPTGSTDHTLFLAPGHHGKGRRSEDKYHLKSRWPCHRTWCRVPAKSANLPICPHFSSSRGRAGGLMGLTSLSPNAPASPAAALPAVPALVTSVVSVYTRTYVLRYLDT
jgi:hypothetical protein